MLRFFRTTTAAVFCLLPLQAFAQTPTDTTLAAVGGLVPVTALENTPEGQSALKANFKVTGAIQDGSARQPLLLPWPDAQKQALKDAYITFTNANELADALGSKLGGAYRAATACTKPETGKPSKCADLSPAVAKVIGYAVLTAEHDAGVGKFFFANATTDGRTPAPPEAMKAMSAVGGKPDMFGRAYNLPAGSPNANPFGNSRPFQTEPHLTPIEGPDFFGAPSTNMAYLRGPEQDLTKSPSYPSGHTTYGYTESLILALLAPERYPQMVVRAAEYGNSRIVVGAHYAMDVLSGRTVALYDLAQMLANKPGYVGVERHQLKIDDFRAAVAEARAEFAKTLAAPCGGPVAGCMSEDSSRFADAATNEAFYNSTQTYDLGIVFKPNADKKEEVAKLAPEAGYLLTVAYPKLTLEQANRILTETEGPGGGFLDNGSAFGVYSRLDLYHAALKAAALGR
ncbi:MAG TPA: phosphatase PAP2 family protein [Alphaproteobacteria bacterium]|nr:phosphatase PAP2 family protein [Alphaproteobacteria bacterium]